MVTFKRWPLKPDCNLRSITKKSCPILPHAVYRKDTRNRIPMLTAQHSTAQHRTKGAGKQHGSHISPLPKRSSQTFPHRALPPPHQSAPAAEPTPRPHRPQRGNGALRATPSRPARGLPHLPGAARHRTGGSRGRAGTAAALEPVPRRREERALTSPVAVPQLRRRPLPTEPSPASPSARPFLHLPPRAALRRA